MLNRMTPVRAIRAISTAARMRAGKGLLGDTTAAGLFLRGLPCFKVLHNVLCHQLDPLLRADDGFQTRPLAL